jgi:uracil phosphoribosyltransferase
MCTTTGDVDQPLLDLGPSVQVSKHPVLSHKITVLRSSQTKPSSFRAVLKEITYHLGYEATSTLKTKPVAISVPSDDDLSHVECTGQKLAERVALVPILRSGLGMTESMLELLPNAGVHHIGMYKKKGQMPVQYYNRLPRDCQADVAYVLDPVIASATTVMSVVGILKKVQSFLQKQLCSDDAMRNQVSQLYPLSCSGASLAFTLSASSLRKQG